MGDRSISRGWVMPVEVPVDDVCAMTIIGLSGVDMLRRQQGQGKDSQDHQTCGPPEECPSHHTSSISGGQPDGQASASRHVTCWF
jgi:hypothetical protein